MKLSPSKITSSVGYSFAIAALCSLAITPQIALAEENASQDANSDSSSSASTGKRVYDAPVASEKSETVYVFANPDGSVKNTEVSTTLKNQLGEDELADSSVLTDIENVENDATFSGSGDDMVWNASGKDVYYTGITTKDSPVSVKVSYYLDGEKVSYKELAGASGKLKIRYDYGNEATVEKMINGKDETLYVPFTFITAILFDNDSFKNPEVTNGKVIDDGDRTIIAGYAIPGLQKSLGDLAEDLDIPEYFEVSADVSNFEMKSSLTIATAGLLEDFNADDLDTSELEDASGELADAMDKVLEGTGSLKEGLNKLADGADKLSSGTSELAGGIGTAKDTAEDKTLLGGMNSLKEGYDEKLLAPVKDTVTKVKTFIDENRTNLTVAWEALQGMDKAIDALGKSIDALGKVDKNDLDALAAQLDDLQSKLDSASSEIDKAQKMVAAFESIDLSGIEGALTAVGSSMTAAGSHLEEAGGLLQNGVATDLGNIASNTQSAAGSLGEIQSGLSELSGMVDSLPADQQEAFKSALASIQNGLGGASGNLSAIGENLSSTQTDLGKVGESINNAGNELKSGGATLQEVGKSLNSLKDSLPSSSDISKIKGLLNSAQGALTDENIAIMDQCISSLSDAMGKLDVDELNGEIALMKKYYPQIVKYLESTSAQKAMKELETKLDETVEGMDQVSKGLDEEQKGMEKLAEGADKLKSGSSALAKGADEAANGSSQLLEGIETLNNEGISEITDLVDNDIVSFKDRLQALTDAARDYNNFAGITEGTAGSVKFVIETDPITLE